MKDCCANNLDKLRKVARAKWVCPVCGTDCSFDYVLYMDCLERNKNEFKANTDKKE